MWSLLSLMVTEKNSRQETCMDFVSKESTATFKPKNDSRDIQEETH